MRIQGRKQPINRMVDCSILSFTCLLSTIGYRWRIAYTQSTLTADNCSSHRDLVGTLQVMRKPVKSPLYNGSNVLGLGRL